MALLSLKRFGLKLSIIGKSDYKNLDFKRPQIILGKTVAPKLSAALIFFGYFFLSREKSNNQIPNILFRSLICESHK
jgi:hypothetical protein